MAINITRAEWNEYRAIQDSGMFNMFSPDARAMTDISKDKWLYIIKNYSQLRKEYDG